MSESYVHGYHPRENERLQDQAGALVDLLHSDTAYPAGSTVLEAGCGVGAQTIPLARRSPGARFTAIDVSADSLAEAQRRTKQAGLSNVEFQQADIFALPFSAESFDHVFVCFVLEHLARPIEALADACQIEVDDGFIGAGYAQPTLASREAQSLAAHCEALFVDHSYTAKALAALIRYVRASRFTADESVLFWHTGGQLGLFA